MNQPWYQQIHVMGQTNLNELDGQVCDVCMWEKYWEETGTQAIVVNAGGIVGFYPSESSDQRLSPFLNGRDLFGEFVAAARKRHIHVIARMDISCVSQATAQKHPDWVVRKEDGSIQMMLDRVMCCVNSDYYTQQIPDRLREVCRKYHPAGFADNSWTGPGRAFICHCGRCREGFKACSGRELPKAADYDDPVYREWIRWNYDCRMRNWTLYNQTVREAGGEDTLWCGMINANFVSGHLAFCDLHRLAGCTKLLMVDHQSRDGNGYEQNTLNGKILHQLVGWDVPVFQSMATYVRGLRPFRHSANPQAEMNLWMREGFAGGIDPWWHILGTQHEDRRIYDLPKACLQEHEKVFPYLRNRTPVANIGVLWSQENVEFYGREKKEERVELAIRGILRLMTRYGFSYLPVHADDLELQGQGLDLLILPEMAVLSQKQMQSIRAFAARGGSLLVLGRAGILDETGAERTQNDMADLTGCSISDFSLDEETVDSRWDHNALHNYIRILQERHLVFGSFADTDMLPGGARCHAVEALPGTKVLAGLIPAYPIYPPEFSWRIVQEPLQPVLTERALPGGGICLFSALPLDRMYAQFALPDHGQLLAGMVRYLCRPAVCWDGEGYVDVSVYRQGEKLIVHINNLTVQSFQPGYAERVVPVANVCVDIMKSGNWQMEQITADSQANLQGEDGRIRIRIPCLHETALLVLSPVQA